MARDLEESAYYTSRGGRIPVKWTAPEVCNYHLHPKLIFFYILANQNNSDNQMASYYGRLKIFRGQFCN